MEIYISLDGKASLLPDIHCNHVSHIIKDGCQNTCMVNKQKQHTNGPCTCVPKPGKSGIPFEEYKAIMEFLHENRRFFC